MVNKDGFDIYSYPELFQSITNLGLAFTDCPRLISFSEEVPTAAWAYSPATGKEDILINPSFLEELDATGCEIVLRHEIQHKALYKEMILQGLDHLILNIALDAAISRVLSRSFPRDVFRDFCETQYGKTPENVESPLALAWYGLDPNRIQNPVLRDLYRKFWSAADDPSPLAIYYDLVWYLNRQMEEGPTGAGGGASGKGSAQGETKSKRPGRAKGANEETQERSKGQKKGGPESEGEKKGERRASGPGQPGGKKGKGQGRAGPAGSKGGKGDSSGNGESDRRVRTIPLDDPALYEQSDLDQKVLSRMGGGRWGMPAAEGWMEELRVRKSPLDLAELEAFIGRIESVDVIDKTAERIRNAIHPETRAMIYPLRPTRLGHVYILTGLSQRLHLYYNRQLAPRVPRLNIYLDVSPSMEGFRGQEVFLIDRLKDFFPSTFYAFASGVREISVTDFAQGLYPQGSGTNFNAVLRHFMDSDVMCGVIFTDGFCSVSTQVGNPFRRSGRRLFTVYFNDRHRRRKDGPRPVKSDLDPLSEEVMQIDVFKPTMRN